MDKKNLVKGWDKVNIRQYKQIQKLKDNINEDTFLEMIAVLYNTNKENILNTKLVDLEEMSEAAEFLKNKPKKTLVRGKYKLNGNTYVFKHNIDDILTSQYIDFQNFIKETDDLEILLSVFLIPEGKTYNDNYDIEDVRNDILDYLSVEEAQAITDFFTIRFQRLTVKLIRQTKKSLKQAKKAGAITEEQEKLLALCGLISLKR